MKTKIFIGCTLMVLISLTACSNFDKGNKEESSNYTITITSPEGSSVLNVSDSGLINRSVYVESETKTVTTREYSYDAASNIRSVYVDDNMNNSYVIEYGNVMGNTARTAVENQEMVPETIKFVSKTISSGGRAASADITDIEKIEYYYDENGNLTGVVRIDTNGNVMAKGK